MPTELLEVTAGDAKFYLTKDVIVGMPHGRLSSLLNEAARWHMNIPRRMAHVDCNADVFAVILNYIRTGTAEATDKVSAATLKLELARFFANPPNIQAKDSQSEPGFCEFLALMFTGYLFLSCLGLVPSLFARI